MKIVSWNIWESNPNHHKIFRLIKNSKADIICLQEVSYKLLKKLSRLKGFYIYKCVDFLKNGKRFYLVTLSKYKAVSYKVLNLPNSVGSAAQRWLGWSEFTESLYIDVMVKNKLCRVFNIHLECANRIKNRINQFKTILKHKIKSKNGRNIFCGDFNSFGKWYLSMFVGWVFRFSFAEMIANEKKIFENIFSKHRLYEICGMTPTYYCYLFQSKLDYILVDAAVKVLKESVMKEHHGSDHYPVEVVLSI